MYSLKSVSYRYPEQTTQALSEINLFFEEGEFVILAGPNGGGKSTLLRALMGVIPSHVGGAMKGEILFRNKSVGRMRVSELAGSVGIVFQDPETQITNLTVGEEVAFGPENLCWDCATIQKLTTEALVLMELTGFEQRSVLSLSGGQKQRLSLAALLAMKPEVLILDEPMAHLDVWGLVSLVGAIEEAKKHCKLIVLATHFLDPFLHLATRLIVMDHGMVQADIAASEIPNYIESFENWGIQVPQILEMKKRGAIAPIQSPQNRGTQGDLISVKDIHYRYAHDEKDVLTGVSIDFGWNERIALAGRNGSGKSTLARLLVGLRKPTRGRIVSCGRGVLTLQYPTLGFITASVQEEIVFGSRLGTHEVASLLDRFDLSRYAGKSPFQLSAGEQRRLAIASALAQEPDLLVLDEPTAGVDLRNTQIILSEIKSFAGSVLHITHDPRVVANTERAVVMERGGVVFDGMQSEMEKTIVQRLGYDRISAVAKLAIDQGLWRGIPLVPDQLSDEEESS